MTRRVNRKVAEKLKMATKYQTRTIELTAPEVRDGDNGVVTIAGYGLKWAEEANIGGWFRERFEKGAFARTLRDDDAKLLAAHGSGTGLPLASTRNKTFKISEDTTGLKFEAELDTDADPEARSVAAKIRRGDVDKMSIGFYERKYRIEKPEEKGKPPLVIHTDVRLLEISVVPHPAYESSSVGARRSAESLREAVDKVIESDHKTQDTLQEARTRLASMTGGSDA